MVNRIGQGGAAAREAILAAMKSQVASADSLREAVAGAAEQADGSGPAGTQELDFASKLQDGLTKVDDAVKATEDLPRALVAGEVKDFHEVAVQVKTADLSFRFALEVRNKLIDAYREVMRMNV